MICCSLDIHIFKFKLKIDCESKKKIFEEEGKKDVGSF